MITTSKAIFPFAIDVGRPVLIEPRQFEIWKDFHDLVENSSIEIAVNMCYPEMQHFIDNEKQYSGSGFTYMFWFRTKEDREYFVNELKAIERWNPTFIDLETC
jgi:hypothetical protein